MIIHSRTEQEVARLLKLIDHISRFFVHVPEAD